MKQGSWSITVPVHTIAMRANNTTLSKSVMGCAMMLFPARTFRMIGIEMRINATGKSHITPNNVTGKPSW